jgi:hypothetical protein
MRAADQPFHFEKIFHSSSRLLNLFGVCVYPHAVFSERDESAKISRFEVHLEIPDENIVAEPVLGWIISEEASNDTFGVFDRCRADRRRRPGRVCYSGGTRPE